MAAVLGERIGVGGRPFVFAIPRGGVEVGLAVAGKVTPPGSLLVVQYGKGRLCRLDWVVVMADPGAALCSCRG